MRLVGGSGAAVWLALLAAGCSASGGSPRTDGGPADATPRACVDVDVEPNDTEETATRIDVEPPWGCDNVVDVSGNVDADDVDVWSIPGGTTNGTLCSEVRTAFVGTFAGLELCVFAECAVLEGPEPFAFECRRGDAATSADGRQGCCTREGLVSIHLVCSEGAGTAVRYYARVRQPESSACYPYRLRLDYR